MTRRYRHIPLSDDRLKHYERMHFHVTRKRFGEYTDVDMDIAQHCTDVRIPFFIIHNPRRYCSLEMDWSPAGLELSLPGYKQVQRWAEQVLERSPAAKKTKGVIVGPKGAIVHGLELLDAQSLARHVWEWLASEAPSIRGDPRGDAA